MVCGEKAPEGVCTCVCVFSSSHAAATEVHLQHLDQTHGALEPRNTNNSKVCQSFWCLIYSKGQLQNSFFILFSHLLVSDISQILCIDPQVCGVAVSLGEVMAGIGIGSVARSWLQY